MQSSEILVDAALAGNETQAASAIARDPGVVRQSMCAAAAVADAGAVFALLEADPSVADRSCGRRGWKPLLYLCSSRYRRGERDAARVAIARGLLESGAAVTGRETSFQSTHGTMLSEDNELLAIEAAAGRCASPGLIQLLLDSGADLSQTTVALLQAVRGGNAEVLQRLLRALPPEVLWQVGWALQESVVLGRRDMARMLADHAELPAENALLEAIRLGRDPEMLAILLGEDRTSGRSRRVRLHAYRCAIRRGHSAAIELLGPQDGDEAAVTAVDRVLGACVTGDRAALAALRHTYGYPPCSLRDEDHRMLSWAIRTGRHQAVPLLLEAGLDPGVADTDGETPLRLAVRSGVMETVDALIRAGATVDARNFDAQTPLEAALALTDDEARQKFTNRLLEAGASPVGRSQLRHAGAMEGLDPDLLFEQAADAAVSGDFDRLREMLDEEPALVHARSPRPHRATLLHYCGANGVEEARQRTPGNAPAIAQLLLDRGADVNATCNLYRGGATTLGLLLSSVHPLRAGVRTALFEILLRAGAKLDGARGAAGLSGAAALGRLDLVKDFFEKDGLVKYELTKEQIQSAFLWGCEFGRTGVIEFLLDKGADPRAQNRDGQTGLHLAALAGHRDAVKLLLNRQAPLEVQNVWRGTVLSSVLWAAVNHDPNVDYAPIVEMLIDAGATVEPELLTWWHLQNVLIPRAKPRIEELLSAAACPQRIRQANGYESGRR